MQQQRDYDLIIVGGGVVGLTLANALAPTSLRLAILDQETPLTTPATTVYDLRVNAINLYSQQVFQQLGVWSALMAARVAPFREIQVWDAVGQGAIRFSSQQLAEPQLGHIIEQRVMSAVLRDRLRAFENVETLDAVRPQTLAKEPDKAVVELADGRQLTSSLLVGADGAHSWVRQAAGIALHEWPYHHHALVTTIHTELPHQDTAWQCCWPEGLLALLPLAEPHHCSIVWSTVPAKAEQLLRLPEEDFNQALTTASTSRLGRLRRLDRLLDFPLQMRHARQYVKPNLALIGDAAHTVHPLAGQGVNLGIADAMCLAATIKHALRQGRAIGGWQTLRRYERSRKGDNWRMIAFLELFKRLFASRLPFVIHARALGLNITDQQTWLKHFFVREAMGVGMD